MLLSADPCESISQGMIKLLAAGLKCAINITFSFLPVSRESAKVNTGILM